MVDFTCLMQLDDDTPAPRTLDCQTVGVATEATLRELTAVTKA